MDVAKNIDYAKNSSKKSCWELNFLQKTQRTRISISLGSIAGKLQWFATKLDGIFMEIGLNLN